MIRDLASTNGTKVKGQKIRWAALLPDDRLTFGGYKMRVYLGPDTAPGPSELARKKASKPAKGGGGVRRAVRRRVPMGRSSRRRLRWRRPRSRTPWRGRPPTTTAATTSGSWRERIGVQVEEDDDVDHRPGLTATPAASGRASRIGEATVAASRPVEQRTSRTGHPGRDRG